MKKHAWLTRFTMAAFMVSLVIVPATSAPMFPDLPQEHWAKDAVAALAAKGLVEGYPDGTFKGDRAATRYEVAMIVARFLAKVEQEHATFATKADLEALRRLVNQLKDELDALGVRVQNLENNVGKLDKRVTELERIRFYGWSDTRFVSQGFLNNGLTLGTGGNVQGAAATFGATNYNAAIANNQTQLPGNFLTGLASEPSATTGARINFFGSSTTGNGLADAGLTGFVNKNVPLVVPVIDYLNGTPLTNGTGFSNVTTLGARIKVSDDVDAGAEFSAYVTAGDAIVDAFFGVTAPFLNNQFNANPGLGSTGQGLNNQPFTRMNLDNFWMIHKPSGLKVQIGSFDGTNFDDIIYVGEYNPNPLGPRYLDNFGLDVRGRSHLIAPFTFEVMGTLLADGNLSPFSSAAFNAQGGAVQQAQSPFGIFNANGGYAPEAYGVNLDFDLYGNGDFKLNFLRAQDAQANGQPLLVGQITGMNGTWLNWVNPNGFFVGQTGVQAESTLLGAGTNSAVVGTQVGTVGTIDNRPIFSADGTRALDSAGGLGGIQQTIPGTFGPQEETSYAASLRYKFPGTYGFRVFFEYGNTNYRPSQNSSFNTTGSAFLGGAGAVLGNFDLSAEYVTVQPNYDPFILQYPAVDGVQNDYWRIRSFSYFPNAYPLHDTDQFPQNRQGVRGHVRFLAKDDKGEKREIFHGWYYNLSQVQTSLPDQRFTVGSLGNGIPNANVLGFSPGFMDPVFEAFSPFAFTSGGTSNGFLTPLDNNNGTEVEYGGHFKYRFGSTPWAIGLGYENLQFTRNSNFTSAGAGVLGANGFAQSSAANMDFVNLQQQGGVGTVSYTFSDRFVLKFGISVTNIQGHYDPAGVFNAFAFDTGNNSFLNVNTTQNYPFVGFDYDISKNTRWNFNVKFFNTTDQLSQTSFLTAGPIPSNIQRNPFNWSGVQVTSQVKVSF